MEDDKRFPSFIGGKHVENFEAEWAAYCDADCCVGVDSGTSAIELALRGFGIGPGDEVIVPTFTFIGTAEAVAAVGARVVFADVNAATLLMGADEIRQVMSARTAAVIVVHLYGQPADMDAISSLAKAAHIAVVEDAAQAHGAKWRGRPVGSCSNACCFSFYPTKNLGAFGDADAVVTNDSALAERISLLSNHGRPPRSDDLHELVGGTHRLDALQAAVLSVKLKRLNSLNAARARGALIYGAAVKPTPSSGWNGGRREQQPPLLCYRKRSSKHHKAETSYAGNCLKDFLPGSLSPPKCIPCAKHHFLACFRKRR